MRTVKRDGKWETIETILDEGGLLMEQKGVVSNVTTAREFKAPDAPRQRVRCPDHDVWMRYIPAEDLMSCPEPTCRKIAQRKHNFASYWEVDGDGVNTPGSVYRGELKLVRDEAGELFLYLVDLNGLVAIGELMTVAKEANEAMKVNASPEEPT